MDTKDIISNLETNLVLVQALLRGVSEDLYRWKPDAESWSVLEILNHLVDEEAEDFRLRAGLLLHSPDADWQPLNSWDWIETRAYNSRDPQDSLAAFERERRKSLDWLRGLVSPDWDRLHTGEKASDMRLRSGDILVSWVAHDYFHVCHIQKRKWQFWNQGVAPYSTDYAGTIEDLP